MTDTSTTNQKIAAEVFGTFILVFFGCGTVVMTTLAQSPAQYLAVALAFGFALMVGIYTVGRISGGHFNPAVSVGAAISGRMAWGQVPLYVGSQVAGGVLGALLLFVITKALPDGALPDNTMGQNFFGDGGFSWWGALVVEVALTAVFVTVILAVTDARNEHPAFAPMGIGLALVVIHLIAIPLTGTSVNPARSIGPALFAGTDAIKDLWLFILAPLLGAVAAGLAYPAVFGQGSEPVVGSGLKLRRPAAGTPGAPAAAMPGYGAPDQFQQEWNQQDYPAAQAAATYEPEPIIQDGWQWDHQAQEWKPLEHWTNPAESATATQASPLDSYYDATSKVVPGPAAGVDPAQQPWDPDTEHTQVRRRDEP